ncbi:MAG: sulfite exporter TauE/SafE family protein [Spirochaetaceae bacterium]|jgi:sulfite exporter TauE/SafE/copper chaperone CopZ|nr:sulfite exporter TauE/SafE family protein [Spirochaetaceae bacterium]
MRTDTITITGMTCAACQSRIEKKLRAAPGIESADVDYVTGKAAIAYDPERITRDTIAGIIRSLDYGVADGQSTKGTATATEGTRRTLGLLAVIASLAMLTRQFAFTALTGAFPLAEAGMGYGMLFVIGLITSVHCIAMCGGINLSQTIKGGDARNLTQRRGDAEGSFSSFFSSHSEFLAALRPSVFYNAGRVISYTFVGGVVGALGAVVSFSGRARGIVQLAAGAFMVIMGLNMLGIFPSLRSLTPRLPRFFAKKIDAQKEKSRSPLIIGLLNGLMPCGPLQAMQIYALSTGSPVKGALSMLLFSLGTVPLMFALGAASSLLSKKFTRHVMTAGAVIVAVMGITMVSYGWSLGGLPSPTDAVAALFGKSAVSAPGAAGTSGNVVGGVQVVNSTLASGRYPEITVQAGIPVKWNINAPAGSINGCNNRMIIPEYGIEHRFTSGDNIIEFTPEKAGKFRYSCWMGMIRSSITVLAEGEEAAAPTGSIQSAPVSAGYAIPTEEVALSEWGEINGQRIQRVRIALTDDGFSPAVMVMEEGVFTEWIIDNQSLEAGSAALLVPAYYAQVPLERQKPNSVGLEPQFDFAFSTGDSIFFGYAKVVPDIKAADLGAIRAEAASFETLVYPEEYFTGGSGGASCCQ